MSIYRQHFFKHSFPIARSCRHSKNRNGSKNCLKAGFDSSYL